MTGTAVKYFPAEKKKDRGEILEILRKPNTKEPVFVTKGNVSDLGYYHYRCLQCPCYLYTDECIGTAGKDKVEQEPRELQQNDSRKPNRLQTMQQ